MAVPSNVTVSGTIPPVGVAVAVMISGEVAALVSLRTFSQGDGTVPKVVRRIVSNSVRDAL